MEIVNYNMCNIRYVPNFISDHTGSAWLGDGTFFKRDLRKYLNSVSARVFWEVDAKTKLEEQKNVLRETPVMTAKEGKEQG